MAIEEAVIKCSSCGAPVHAGAPSCTFCGAELVHPAGTATGPGQGAAGFSQPIEALRSAIVHTAGATEQQYAYASPEQCVQFAQKLGARLLAVSNEVLAHGGRSLRVNYLHGASPADAQAIYRSMVSLVGKSNLVARKGDVVVEVITGDSRDAKAVLAALAPDEHHHTHHLLW
jgi:hypothetical protein